VAVDAHHLLGRILVARRDVGEIRHGQQPSIGGAHRHAADVVRACELPAQAQANAVGRVLDLPGRLHGVVAGDGFGQRQRAHAQVAQTRRR
jgi:hypothetical protein